MLQAGDGEGDGEGDRDFEAAGGGRSGRQVLVVR